MLTSTLSRLKCPASSVKTGGPTGVKKSKPVPCNGSLDVQVAKKVGEEIQTGTLVCWDCDARFPILAGVAVLVPQVGEYLFSHVKGIAELVDPSEIPEEYRAEFAEAKSELDEVEMGIPDEDLESERVNALYLMTHYLKAGTNDGSWAAPTQRSSGLIARLVEEYWDHGPFAQIRKWLEASAVRETSPIKQGTFVELGCGVGGLYRTIQPHVGNYLGVDYSFASIALARHLNLGVPYPKPLRIPQDLLKGQVSRTVEIETQSDQSGRVDFVVGELEGFPVRDGEWDFAVALNLIDMMNRPAYLPELQRALLKPDGVAIQSDPYIWHDSIAGKLRSQLPRGVDTSSAAVQFLYEKCGFKLEEAVEELPWLFFKHFRQLEVYLVHIFWARKQGERGPT